MNHQLSLSLELLELRARGLRFRMAMQNRSPIRLFFPFPEIHGLRFASADTMEESEWYTSLFVSATGGGFTLNPGDSRAIEWRVRPCEVERPESDDHSDYYRWCVDLPAGEYLAWFRWRVDRDFFDPDSHMRLPDLEREAARSGATVWLGEASSNRVAVAWAHPGAAAYQMCDAKWRELFPALRELGVGPLRWKFVHDDRVYVEAAPAAESTLERSLGDVLPYPYAPFREIEWIEVPVDRSGAVAAALASIDRLPVRQYDSGVRVLGNAW
jgi:hypothetical protein